MRRYERTHEDCPHCECNATPREAARLHEDRPIVGVALEMGITVNRAKKLIASHAPTALSRGKFLGGKRVIDSVLASGLADKYRRGEISLRDIQREIKASNGVAYRLLEDHDVPLRAPGHKLGAVKCAE